MNKYIFILILLIFEIGYSEVSITSVSLSNGHLIIDGSGFGTYIDNNASYDYLCAAWENIETGTISATTSDLVTGSGGPELYSGAFNKTNSSYCAKGFMRIGNVEFTNLWGEAKIANAGTLVQHTSTTGAPWPKVVFMSGWYMFPPGFMDAIATEPISQSKFMTVYPTNDNGVDNSKTFWIINSTGYDAYLAQNWEDGRMSNPGLLADGGKLTSNVTEGVWYRYDIAIDTSKEEGAMLSYFYVNGMLITKPADYYYVEQDACCDSAPCDADDYGCPRSWEWFRWLQYIRNEQSDDTVTWDIYLDDMYASYTWARVELSDYSTWDETAYHHKELQPPTVWSTTSITTIFNQGTLQKGDTVYVYVINESNEVNLNGFQFSIPQDTPVSTSAIVKASTGASFVKASSGTTILKAQ